MASFDADREAVRKMLGDDAMLERSPADSSARAAAVDWGYVEDRALEARDDGLRTIERHADDGYLTPAAADRLDNFVGRDDVRQYGARYLTAVGKAEYRSAFAKMLAHPQDAHLRFTPQETAAVQQVHQIEQLRALGDATTGVPLPFTLDPSIIMSSTGVSNPFRAVSRVETISTLQWKGVASDGVTASFVAEATEATDNSPTLVQPTIQAAKAHCFVPYSIEVGQDWATLEHELARLFTDQKNVLEATAFLTGTGSNQPGGILNIGGTGGLTTTQRVQTNTVATYAVGDPWLLKAAIPPRFLAQSTFFAAPATWDTTYRFVAQGSTTEPRQFSDGDRGGDFLGQPKLELSTMATGSTTGTKLMVVGDFSKFLIADRIGGTVEIAPLLFGATNRFPTGQRGAYYYWRVGSGVLAPNAFRYLEVK